jgi:hypothetical protein
MEPKVSLEEVDTIVKNYEETYKEYNNFLEELSKKEEQLNHVKNINDINKILFDNDVDINRILPNNSELFKNKCLIDNCQKMVCYQLNFTNNKKLKKYICWYHLCNLIQNFQ